MAQLDRRGALRLFASLGAAGVAAPLLSACEAVGVGGDDDGKSKGSVKLGLLIPQSGPNKYIGDEMQKGFELFRNLNGGRLGGYDVELVIADEGAGAESGKAGIEKLVKQDKVLAVSGVASPAVMVAVRDTVESGHVPLIGSHASPESLLNTLYIWRTSYADADAGRALGEYVAGLYKDKGKVLVTGPDSERDGVAGFITTFSAEYAVGISATVYTPPGSTDFTQVLAAAKSNPDVKAIYANYGGVAGQEFVKQFAAAKLKGNMQLFAPGFMTEGVNQLKAQGEDARGIYTSLNYSPDLDNAANRVFSAEYQKAHRATPTTYAMASYDAAGVLNKALGLVEGELTGESLNAAIGRVGQISSPRGDWQFNQTRSPLQKWYLRQVRLDGTVLTNNVISELVTLG